MAKQKGTIKERALKGIEIGKQGLTGRGFENAMVVIYEASRHYPYEKASRRGDFVSRGTHYQVKGERGTWQHVSNPIELAKAIQTERATRFILSVDSFNAKKENKVKWIDISKEELLSLIETPCFKFDIDSRKKNGFKSNVSIARWRGNSTQYWMLKRRFTIHEQPLP